MASAGLSYQILDWLNVAGRVRIDNTHSEYEGKLYASSSNTLTDGSSQGHYTVNNGQYSQTYADVLVNINKRIQDFTIVANIGASYSGVTSKELGYAGPIRETGIPNLFNVYDLDKTCYAGGLARSDRIYFCQCRSRVEKYALSHRYRT